MALKVSWLAAKDTLATSRSLTTVPSFEEIIRSESSSAVDTWVLVLVFIRVKRLLICPDEVWKLLA